MNCISYSIFGYNQQYENCYEFRSYLRGLHINIRIGQLLYPGWDICVMADESVLVSPYYPLLSSMNDDDKIKLNTVRTAELCTMMLYRLCPLFFNKLDGSPYYERIVCRDTDSLLCYRERQAIEYWCRGTKMAHSMTDSISHNIPLMGGMIGFCSGYFRDRMEAKNLGQLLLPAAGIINFNHKGADQQFLNRYVLPKVADSITEHYVLGHPQTFRGDCHNFIHDIDLKEISIPDYLKETNGYGFHIGASGFQTDAVVKFLEKHGTENEYWETLEKQYPEIFYWQL